MLAEPPPALDVPEVGGGADGGELVGPGGELRPRRRSSTTTATTIAAITTPMATQIHQARLLAEEFELAEKVIVCPAAWPLIVRLPEAGEAE